MRTAVGFAAILLLGLAFASAAFGQAPMDCGRDAACAIETAARTRRGPMVSDALIDRAIAEQASRDTHLPAASAQSGWDRVVQLPPRAAIVLVADRQTAVSGRFVSADAFGLTWQPDHATSTATLRRDAVLEIRERTKSHVALAVAIGGGVGFAAGFVATVLLEGNISPLVGMPVAGMVVGHRTRPERVETIYRREAGKQ